MPSVQLSPVCEEQVQQALVASVESPMLCAEFHQIVIGLLGRFEHEDARVEIVGPAHIGGSGNLRALEELV